MSEGTRTILLTVLISGAAAILFPVKQDEANSTAAEGTAPKATDTSSEVSDFKADQVPVTENNASVETMNTEKGDNIHE